LRDGLFGGFRHAERRGDFIDKTAFFDRRLDLDNGADFIHNRFFVDEIQDVFRPGARQRFDISRLISFSVFLQRVADGFFGNYLLFGERRDDFLDFVDFAFLVIEVVYRPKVIDVPAEFFQYSRLHCHAVFRGRDFCRVLAVRDDCENILVFVAGIDDGDVDFEVGHADVRVAQQSAVFQVFRDVFADSFRLHPDVLCRNRKHLGAAFGVFEEGFQRLDAHAVGAVKVNHVARYGTENNHLAPCASNCNVKSFIAALLVYRAEIQR